MSAVRTHLLRLTVALAALALPATVLADTGELAVDLGATRVLRAGDVSWQPTLRTDFAFDIVGPLQAGMYGQLVGAELPMQSPGIGGGLTLAVRPELPIIRLRPVIELSGGRQRLRLPQADEERVWVTTAAVGLGVVASDLVTLEGRVSHTWLHGLESTDLDDRAWQVMVGLRFRIP
ncbi:MAG: hypothetical protein KF901_00160 [Myxococcales bacterium]|nr:hypothetical protein [Myxococcales bacterium]